MAHAIPHESAWISTGPKQWGNQTIDTVYTARVPVRAGDCEQDVFREIKYLPGIAHLARLGHLQLFTSAELGAEQFRQPIGRFRGHHYDDLNLFAGLPFASLDGRHFDLENPKGKQLQRISCKSVGMSRCGRL